MSTKEAAAVPPVTNTPGPVETTLPGGKEKSSSKVWLWVLLAIILLGGLTALVILVILPAIRKKPAPAQTTTIDATLTVSAPLLTSLTPVNVTSASTSGAANISASVAITGPTPTTDNWTATLLIYTDSAGSTLATAADYTLTAPADITLGTDGNGSPTFSGTGSTTTPLVFTLASLNNVPLYLNISASDTTNSANSTAGSLVSFYPIVIAQNSGLTAGSSSGILPNDSVTISYSVLTADPNAATDITGSIGVFDTSDPPQNLLASGAAKQVILGTSNTGYAIDSTTNLIDLTFGASGNTTVTPAVSGSINSTLAPAAGASLQLTQVATDCNVLLSLQSSTCAVVGYIPLSVASVTVKLHVTDTPPGSSRPKVTQQPDPTASST